MTVQEYGSISRGEIDETHDDIARRASSHQAAWDRIDAVAETEVQWLDLQASYLRSLMAGQDDRLGRIGAGVQYVVYELPNSRVFKVARTPMSARKEYQRQGGDTGEVDEILRLREEGSRYVRRLVSEHPEASTLFGNPVFNGENDTAVAFEQDRLNFFEGDSFNALPAFEQLNYVHSFIKIVKSMWTYGCSDRSMNFQVNTGLNSEGGVAIADFGEMDISQESALQTIRNKRWRTAWGVRNLGQETQAAAIKMFEWELTEDALGSLWAKNLK